MPAAGELEERFNRVLVSMTRGARGSGVECIMRNARLNKAQAGIKVAGGNINNLKYADDTTLMAES